MRLLSVILLIGTVTCKLQRSRRILRKQRKYDNGDECPVPCSCRLPHEVHCSFKFLTAPPAFIPSTSVLNLSFNNIKVIPKRIMSNLTTLGKFTMVSNDLTELNGSQFAGLDQLRSLNLGRNKIQRINRNAFVGSYKLQAILLDHNRIQSIHPITFRGLASLKVLSLEGNQIKTIHPTTFITLVLGNWIPFSSLQIIKLNNNALERLDEDTFRHTHSLKSLTLYNNMWDCSCLTKWFTDFITTYQAVKCPQVFRNSTIVRDRSVLGHLF